MFELIYMILSSFHIFHLGKTVSIIYGISIVSIGQSVSIIYGICTNRRSTLVVREILFYSFAQRTWENANLLAS